MSTKKQVTVDARGLACPGPVMKARNALAELGPGEELVVLVDNAPATTNVSLMAWNQGWDVSVEGSEPEFRITIGK